MSYTSYEEWITYIEDTFAERQKNNRSKSDLSAEERVGGLQAWFTRIKDYNCNIKIRNELNRLASLEYLGQAKVIDMDLILSAWAKHFHEHFYDNENRHVIKKRSQKATKDDEFDVSQKYGRFIRNNWDGVEVMTIKVPSLNDDPKSESSFYWYEICSSLQREYQIFNSIQDINKFIFIVGKNKDTSELLEFGLYIREVQHLCLAFAIMHGYSLSEYRDLYRKASQIEMRGDPNYTATINLTDKAFQKYLMGFSCNINVDDFLQDIKDHSNLLLNKKSFHKTLINDVMESFIDKFEEMLLCDIDSWKKDYHSAIDRVIKIIDIFSDNILNIDFAGIVDDGALRSYLLNRLGITHMKKIIDYSDELDVLKNIRIGAVDEIKVGAPIKLDRKLSQNLWTFMRSMVIVSELYDLENDIDCGEFIKKIDNENVERIIIKINESLRYYNMRLLDYEGCEDNVLNVTHDLFDWAVIESLKYEQYKYKKQIESEINVGMIGITGRTFMRYLKFGHNSLKKKALKL